MGYFQCRLVNKSFDLAQSNLTLHCFMSDCRIFVKNSFDL